MNEMSMNGSWKFRPLMLAGQMLFQTHVCRICRNIIRIVYPLYSQTFKFKLRGTSEILYKILIHLDIASKFMNIVIRYASNWEFII
jgi:hypothetical protein